MIQVQRLRVRSLDVRTYTLAWEIQDTTEDVYDYTFVIERSESQAGPWDELSHPFRDRYRFRDTTLPLASPTRTMFYRIRVTHTPSGEVTYSDVVDAQPEADLITKEVRRHMGLLIREFTGRRAWLLPTRTFGQKCTNCRNTVLASKRTGRCLDCYDTGFLRGFLAPIELWIQVDPTSPLTKQASGFGDMSAAVTTARCVDVDGIKPRDVLVEAENRRWRVLAVNNTEHGRSPIHLELQLREIPKSDVEYEYELKLDTALEDLALSPARNFTNPQNLTNFQDEEIPSILSLYPYVTRPPRT